MPRITDTELDRLKASAPLAALIAADGIALSRQGADLAGLCPFHAEDTPSLKVTPGKNLWHCFGCGAASASATPSNCCANRLARPRPQLLP